MYLKRPSVLKNSFARSSASEPGAENDVFVVFWPCFESLLDRRPGPQRLFQQAGEFSEVRTQVEQPLCCQGDRRLSVKTAVSLSTARSVLRPLATSSRRPPPAP